MFLVHAFRMVLIVQNIRIYDECEGRIEKSMLRITAWHQTVILREGFFFPTYQRIRDRLIPM